MNYNLFYELGIILTAFICFYLIGSAQTIPEFFGRVFAMFWSLLFYIILKKR